jgi:hypothetical protein
MISFAPVVVVFVILVLNELFGEAIAKESAAPSPWGVSNTAILCPVFKNLS